jgi:pimeloyl-ACP methyl ester carboxylesterase
MPADLKDATERANTAEPWGSDAEKNKPAGHYADVNGIKLYYEIHGAGRPLVLLHGGLGAIEMFGPNLAAFAANHRVVAPDLQGHGRTADIDRPIDVRFMADDIAALIKHLGLGRVDVAGYSLGGGVALQVAIRHPEVVDKLVIVSANFRRNAFYPEILAQQLQLNAGMAEMMKQTPMYQLYSAIAPRVEDWPRLIEKMSELMARDFDYSKEIAGLEIPTLVVAGDADIFPPSHAVEMFELLGGGLRDGGWDGSGRTKHGLAILPCVTHYTMFADTRLAPIVTAFLDEGR